MKSEHKIVGVANDYHVALGHFLAPDFDPLIEDILQVHVGEQW